MKEKVTMTIESETIAEARKKFLNVSEISEKALRSAIGKTKIEIKDNPTNCEMCGIEGEKETAEDIKNYGHYSKPNKLIWLWPDEKWICNKCFKNLSDITSVGGRR